MGHANNHAETTTWQSYVEKTPATTSSLGSQFPQLTLNLSGIRITQSYALGFQPFKELKNAGPVVRLQMFVYELHYSGMNYNSPSHASVLV